MNTKHIYRNILSALLLLAFVSCEKDDSDTQPGNSLVYILQASSNGGGTANQYPVTASRQNYTMDLTTNTIEVPLGIYRSGLEDLQAFSVSVQANPEMLQQKLAEIEDAVALPDGTYSFTDKVEVSGGQREADFYLTIDREKLLEQPALYGKKLLVALSLSNPSRYKVSKELGTVVVILSADFLPEPEPTEANIIRNGNFNNGDEYWELMSQDKNPDGTLWSNGTPSFIFTDSKMTISNTSVTISNYAVYQAVQVKAGKHYRFSAEMTASGANNIWFEFYLGKEAPGPFGDYNSNNNETTLLAKLEAWNSGCLFGNVTGLVEKLACAGGAATNGGTVSFDFTGTAYFVVKIGTWDGTIGTITLDNIRILEED